MDGVWQVEKNGVDANACADGYDVNYSSTGIDCYPGKCVSTEKICSADECDACLTESECPTSEGLCQWDGDMCIDGCSGGGNMRCDSCTQKNCTAPCYWDTERNVCQYGAPECSGSSNLGCCDEATYYVVRIPPAFTSTGAPPNDDNEAYNCSPGIFEIELTNTAKGFDQTAESTNSNIQTCKSSSTTFETAFNVDCRKPGSNCYSVGSGSSQDDIFKTCTTKNEFQYLKIQGKAECFFDSSKNSVHYNSSTQNPALFLAQSNTEEQQNWESINSKNTDGQTLWYLISRIFSWTIILSQTSAHQKVLTSTLGLSTLMNDAGLDTDSNSPYVKLESVEDIPSQIASPGGNSWARVQPLMFIDDGGTYHFATLEDIHLGKADSWWKPSYIRQINQFVYDKNATNSQFPTSVNIFAQSGLGNGSSNIDNAINEMQNYFGTLVGSTGFCQNLYSNDIVTYGCFGIAGVVVITLVVLWYLQLGKSN